MSENYDDFFGRGLHIPTHPNYQNPTDGRFNNPNQFFADSKKEDWAEPRYIGLEKGTPKAMGTFPSPEDLLITVETLKEMQIAEKSGFIDIERKATQPVLDFHTSHGYDANLIDFEEGDTKNKEKDNEVVDTTTIITTCETQHISKDRIPSSIARSKDERVHGDRQILKKRRSKNNRRYKKIAI